MGFIERVLAWLGVEAEQGAASEGPPAPPPFPGGREGGEAAVRRGRVVTLPTAAGSPPAASGPAGRAINRLVVFEPRTFDDVQAVAGHLREGRPVVLTLKATDRETARRVVDFVSGTLYALDGSMRRIDDDIFLCSPSGIDVEWEGLEAR
ncbi:MAG TPA: cell division protein SepF [Limnochordales bacterium]